jgi:hypothetical protein
MSSSNIRQLLRTARPSLEALEDRLVPSGVSFDLTKRGAQDVINGAIFQQCDAQPTGTGYIHSFVRLQTNADTEEGYNTDARPVQFDENKSPQFTHSIQVGDAPLVSVGGVLYREFLLDVNQKGSAPLISLDELRVYVASAPNLSGYNPTTLQLADQDPVYDLDQGGDNWVKLNYSLNAGSGSGDMTVLIPAERFGANPNQYVYLYSSFGQNCAANSGFEEWAVRTTPTSAPQGTASLSGTVFQDGNQNGVFDDGDVGIAGATVVLNGVNDLGQNVVLVAVTDVNGNYQFTNLRQGVYSLTEVQPAGYDDGNDTIGTQGGQTTNDRFYDIYLAAAVNGEHNNFGELLVLPNS